MSTTHVWRSAATFNWPAGGGHDQADKIVVLRDGVVEQAGTPIEHYARPVNQFVTGFIGAPQMNFLAAEITEMTAGRMTLIVDRGDRALVGYRVPLFKAGDATTIRIRPEHLRPVTSATLNGVFA